MTQSPHCHRTMLNRADLIRCLDLCGETALSGVAPFLGYERPQPVQKTVHADEVMNVEGTAPPLADENDLNEPDCALPVPFFCAIGYRSIDPEQSEYEEPEWFRKAKPLSDADQIVEATAAPASLPLAKRSRLWPFLRAALGRKGEGHRLDLARIIARIARAEVINRLTRRQRKSWAPVCQVIIDYSPGLLPFWEDFNALRDTLLRLRGAAGMDIQMLDEGPDGSCRFEHHGKELWHEYVAPPPETPVLILSDLGCLDETPYARNAWQRFGQHLRRAGVTPVVLMPCPRRRWDRDVVRDFVPLCWDRGERFPSDLHAFRAPAIASADPEQTKRGDAAAEQLLALLATAIRVEPALLRAVRYLLPADVADVGSEAAVWRHGDVFATPLGFGFSSDGTSLVSDVAERRRGAFKEQAEALQQAAAKLIEQHHAGLPAEIRFEEQDNYSQLTTGKPTKEGQTYNRKVVKTVVEKARGEGFHAWVRRKFSRQHTAMWLNDPDLQAAWVAEHAEALRTAGETITLPPGLNDISRFAWLLQPGSVEPRPHTLKQKGQSLVISPGHFREEKSTDGWDDRGSYLAEVTAGRSTLQVIAAALGNRGQRPVDAIGLAPRLGVGPAAIPLPRSGGLEIESDCEALTVDRMVKPNWAMAIGRDRCGLYADFSYKGVSQRMRWITPGRFMMGSLESELERRDDERRHEVILTQGYWLAETVCTQALWQAVMADNPSRFKGNERPVERVSWGAVQSFIQRLNSEQAGLDLRLPTEAEWEYACREGTTTPFSFGDTVNPEQANYNGNYPYASGGKGQFRKKTVEVKELHRNLWGLYQMHGNVWEWCFDWYGVYPGETVIKPSGPEQGDSRVLRGGSWIHNGRFLRSAYRYHYVPGYRHDDIGFRLARGQKPAEDAVRHEPHRSRHDPDLGNRTRT